MKERIDTILTPSVIRLRCERHSLISRGETRQLYFTCTQEFYDSLVEDMKKLPLDLKFEAGDSIVECAGIEFIGINDKLPSDYMICLRSKF